MKKQKLMFAILFALPFAIASCGQTPTPAHEHKWGDAVYKDEGLHTYTCTECHETKDEEHHEELKEHKDPTCVDEGYDIYTCKECKHELRRVNYDPTGHEYAYITIEEMPTKCSYNAFETLDKAGLKITGHCAHCGEDIELDTNLVEIEYENDDFFTCEDSFVTIKYGKLEEDIEVVVDQEPEEGQIAVNRLTNELEGLPESDKFEAHCHDELSSISGVTDVTLKETSEQELTHKFYKKVNDVETEITSASDLVKEDGTTYFVRFAASQTTNFKELKQDVNLEVDHKFKSFVINYKDDSGAKVYNYFDAFSAAKTILSVEGLCECGHIMDTKVITDNDILLRDKDGNAKTNKILEYGDKVYVKIDNVEIEVEGLTKNKVSEKIDGLDNPSTYCKTAMDTSGVKGHYSKDAPKSVEYYDNNQCTGTPIDITTKVAGDNVWVKAALNNREEFDENSQLNKIETLTINHKLEWVVDETKDDYKCTKCGHVERSFDTTISDEFSFDLTDNFKTAVVDLSNLSNVDYTISSTIGTVSGKKVTVSRDDIFTDYDITKEETKVVTFKATETASGVVHNVHVTFHCVYKFITTFDDLKLMSNGTAGETGDKMKGYYKLKNDIECPSTEYNAGGSLGGDGFSGTLDGDNHIIKNLSIRGGGLFGKGAKNLTVKNISFIGVKLGTHVNGDSYGCAPLFARNITTSNFENINITFNSINIGTFDWGGVPSKDKCVNKVSLLFDQTDTQWAVMKNIYINATCLPALPVAIASMAASRKNDTNCVLECRDYDILGYNGDNLITEEEIKDHWTIRKFDNPTDLDIKYVFVDNTNWNVNTASADGTDKGLLSGALFVDPRTGASINWPSLGLGGGSYKVVNLVNGQGENKGSFPILIVDKVITNLTEWREIFNFTPTTNYTGYAVVDRNFSVGNSWMSNNSQNVDGDTHGFRGTLDGLGHTISECKAMGNNGMFGFLGKGAVVKNLNFNNIRSDANATLIARFINGATVSNCTFTCASQTSAEGWPKGQFGSLFVSPGMYGRSGFIRHTSKFIDVTINCLSDGSKFYEPSKPGGEWLGLSILGANTYSASMPLLPYYAPTFENVNINILKTSLPDPDVGGSLIYGYEKFDFGSEEGERIPITELPEGINLLRK